MNSRQRVMSAFDRTGYDRIPIKHEGTPEINQMIMNHFGLKNTEQMLLILGDDFRYAEPRFCGPELRTFPDGSMEGYFRERYKYAQFEGGKYLESCYQPFAGIYTLDKLDRSCFPSADWFDYSTMKQQAMNLRQRGFAVVCGTAGDMDFINGISRARGMEQVLMDLVDDSPVYLEIMDARFKFFYQMHERMLQAADGLIDFTHTGDDFGNQNGLMISKNIFEKHFAPKYKKYFEMVHRYGAKTILHMCGCAYDLLERLIEIGLDVYDVVQPTTPNMDIANLKAKFGRKLTFCGSVCVQTTLAWGQTQDVKKKCSGDSIYSPMEAYSWGQRMQYKQAPPLENVLALYRTAGSLREDIDESILSIESSSAPDKINMSKLF